MNIEKDFRRMEYTVRITREELEKALSDYKQFDKLITEIAKKLEEEGTYK